MEGEGRPVIACRRFKRWRFASFLELFVGSQTRMRRERNSPRSSSEKSRLTSPPRSPEICAEYLCQSLCWEINVASVTFCARGPRAKTSWRNQAAPKTSTPMQRQAAARRLEGIINLSDMHGPLLLGAIDILPVKGCHLWHHQPLF